MRRSKPSSVGLFAYPISDPPLQFHRFLYEHGHQLGRAGGAVIHWRPIGEPAQADDEYVRVRTPTLEKRDHEDSKKYREESHQLGSQDWLCQREYQKYATELSVEDIEPPLIVFTAKPLTKKAILRFEPVVFDKPEWRRELASILTRGITEEAFSKLRDDGVFTDVTLERVQRHLWRVGQEIFRIYTSRRRKLPKHLKYGISGLPVNEHVDTAQSTKLRWWSREDESLAIDTVTLGKVDGKVEFRLFGGAATMQQRLMMVLLHKHPKPVVLGDVIRELYPDSARAPGNDAEKMRKLINRVRAHVNAIRNKLHAHGIPREILPSVTLNPDLNYQLRLNVFEVLHVEGDYLGIHNLST